MRQLVAVVLAAVAALLALAAFAALAAPALAASPAASAPAAPAAAPHARVDAGPDGRTAERQPLFRFSAAAPGATFECRIVAVGTHRPAFHPCAEVDLPAAELADGDYRFEVRARVGDAGSRGPVAARAFTVAPLLTAPPVVSRACRASVASLRAARRAVITGQRALARALVTERRARARGSARALKAAIRRTTGSRKRLVRAGRRLTRATATAERRCR